MGMGNATVTRHVVLTVVVSHKRTVQSSEAVASKSPDGAQAQSFKPCLCPFNTPKATPVLAFHRRAVLSAAATGPIE